jgi:hypothetical protein
MPRLSLHFSLALIATFPCQRRLRRCACLLAIGAAFGCKASEGTSSKDGAPKAGAAGTLGAEPQHFNFELPATYVPLPLRGEGSETLRAPAAARSTPIDGGFRVEDGADFALEVHAQPLPIERLQAGVPLASRVFEDRDTVVFQAASGLAFVMVRELVPEWDENAPERFSCSSAGVSLDGGATRAESLRFSRAAIEPMVAACRSLDLPKLE